MNKNIIQDKKPEKENLKQRAYLNSITSVLDYGSRVITGFIVTPFLIIGLGSSLFGVWKMLGQFTNYTNLADIKATEVLKWAVAKDRDVISETELREYVTATFVLILLILPFLLIAGSVIAWYSPELTGVGAEYYDIIRITTATLVFALIVSKFFSLFESILRGMNLGYKRMGFRAVIYILGGAGQIAVIKIGYGLIMLAVIQVLVNIIIGIMIYVIVKKNVSWYGWGEVDVKRSFSFLKTGGWFMGWSGVNMLLMNSDKIILGYFAEARLVTQYVITYYLIMAVQGVINNVILGVIPGIGKLYGNKEFKKLLKIRQHTMLLAWILIITFGGTVFLLNPSFIELWVGKEEFAGQFVTFLVIVISAQNIYMFIDQAVINTTLIVKEKVKYGLISSIVSIGISIPLIELLGIAGLCIGIIVGRGIISLSFPAIIYKKTNSSFNSYSSLARIFLVTIILGIFLYHLQEFIFIDGWISLVLNGFLVSVILLIVSFYSGVNRKNRNELHQYFKKLNLFSVKE